MKIEKISQIPGIGSKVAERLIKYLGSEEEIIKVIMEADIAKLMSVPGIGQGLATKIVRNAYSIIEGVSLEEVLKTSDARRLYERILDIIRGYTKTSYSKNKLTLYFPLPPRKINVMLERLNYFSEAKELVKKLDEKTLNEINELLSKIRPLRLGKLEKRIGDRVILTDDEEIYNKLCELELDKLTNMFLVKPGERLEEYIQSYDLVLFISSGAPYDTAIDYAFNAEVLGKEVSVEFLLPERLVSFYSLNYEVVRAACELGKYIHSLPNGFAIEKFKNRINLTALNEVENLLSVLTEDGEVREGYDEELDRLRAAIRDLQTVISDLEVQINDEVKEKIAERKVIIEGERLLDILKEAVASEAGGEGLRNVFPELSGELLEIITEVCQKAEDNLCKKLKLTGEELEFVEELFPRDLVLPIQADRRKVSLLEDFLRKEYALRRYKILREMALKLHELRSAVEEAVKALLDFDLFFAVGRFAKDYFLNVPTLSEEYVGIGFINGRNLFLRELELKNKTKVIPVNYVVGDIPIQPPNTNKERIVVLSGANSGGKTTLLNLIAQIVILAQMGLPVPAEEVYMCPFDEIYLFSRSRGIMDAGAFEATLKNFAKVITSPKKKLVLVDELEAITEPGAAAKVIAGILELLYTNKNTCAIFISHLAEEVMKVVKVPIRVDGIEASGLDENLNLIVNRNPIYNYLARSTPELIVERLYHLSKGSEREVYEKLLEEFGGRKSK